MGKDRVNLSTKRFMSLLVPNQKKIYMFIRYLVPGRTDADDILQETLTEMWNKFDDYQDGTNFVAWGRAIARYKVLSFIQKKKSFGVHFSEKTIHFLQDEACSVQPHNTTIERMETLKECISKLPQKQKKLLCLRYEQDMTFDGIAGQFGLSIPAVYKAISRIHASLAKCIRLALHLKGAI